LGLFLALLSFSLHAAIETNPHNEFALQELKTPAGYSFWYFPMPDAERTALLINWAQEVPLGKGTHPAVAEVGIEVMLNGGAGGRDAAEIVADFEDLDAGTDMWVQPTSVSAFFVAPDEHFSKVRELAEQVLKDPGFEQRWFEREHQNMIESAVDDRSDSWGIVQILAREVILGDHPYNKLWSFNALDDFEAVSLDDVKAWYETSFSTKAAIISVAGSMPANTVAKEIDLLLADFPDNSPVEPIAFNVPDTPGKTVLLHNPDAPKSVVLIAGNFPSVNQDTFTELQIGVGVLGIGKNSRLQKTVRTGLGASYGFEADVIDVTQKHRVLTLSGEIETAKLEEALIEIEKVYEKFRQSGAGRMEFPTFKRFYKREVKKDLQRPVNVAYAVSQAVQSGVSADYLNNMLRNIDSADRSSTNRIISDSFPAYENMLKLIISPDDQAVKGACVITKIEDAQSCP